MDADPRTSGYQRWAMLTFVHWRVPAETLQKLLPRGLKIQQFDGSAWLGVVPFSMERVRPWWSPPVPGVSWFLETNVRTYVIDDRGVAGVWFFSLDANHRLAVNIARQFWHLPYRFATMSLNFERGKQDGVPTGINYSGHLNAAPEVGYEISVNLPDTAPAAAAPETLDYFLLERYLLFAIDRQQRLRTGRVHHPPYQIITPAAIAGQQTLTQVIGCDNLEIAAPDHVAWCAGVDVRVSPLTTLPQP